MAQAEKKDPNNLNNLYLYEHRARVYLRNKQYRKAVADLDRVLELAPRRSYSYKRRALAYFHLSHYEKALADVEKAVECNPDDTSNLTWISPALVVQCPHDEFREEMLALATKAVTLRQDNIGLRIKRVRLYLALERFEETVTNDLARVLQETHDNPLMHYWHALAQLGRGDAESYRETCTTMVERFAHTEDAEAAQWVALTSLLAPNASADFPTAVHLAEQAVNQQPEDGSQRDLSTLGGILYRAGRFQEAAEVLGRLAKAWEESG